MRQPVTVSVLLLALALSGCSTGSESGPDGSATTPPSGAPTVQDSQAAPRDAAEEPLRKVAPDSAGSGGLTVRHLDRDGKIKTVRVEDFPR